jgi:hypothetical protein
MSDEVTYTTTETSDVMNLQVFFTGDFSHLFFIPQSLNPEQKLEIE